MSVHLIHGTVNGFGILRYGWRRRPDGTADATSWVVMAFFPVLPQRREHICVRLSPGEETPTIEVLDSETTRAWEICQTYFNAYIVLPSVTCIIPWRLVEAALAKMKELGVDPAWNEPVICVSALTALIGTAVLVARILDRAVGRLHVFAAPPANDSPAGSQDK